ncbi:MAG: hypothetical protein ACF8AM_04480 [Rhodopirellula sp. JB055]|uniref:hypothetical protein n=1 Tax=Rhodopirellula sp. JB055 TaxID=3342846 RepID=UPI00370C4B15
MNVALLKSRNPECNTASSDHGPSSRGKMPVNRVVVSLMLLCVLMSVGCSRFNTSYGKSDGTSGKTSLNGFGALRDSLSRELTATERSQLGDDWQDAELRARNLTRLSTRANQHDAIVWIPTNWPPANSAEVADWMVSWLRSGNRTIVFIVPDEGSTEAYWREASQVAPPAQRLEYRRRLAQQINLRLLEDVRRDDVTVGRLFTARSLPARKNVDNRRVVSYDLHPFDPMRQTTVATSIPAAQPAGTTSNGDSEVVESDDPVQDQAAEEQSDDSNENARPSIQFEPLDQTDDVTLLARITHPKWKDSRIFVVAGGGLLTNFAMTDEPALEMADRLRAEILSTAKVGPDERVSLGFLSTDDMWVPISDAEPGAPAQTGMELLTTWPISLITIHALFLGVVMCLMLLPTFGRARQVVYHRSTHFGNHLTAMAVLMRRAGGMDFAKEKINHYMRVVRGEPELFAVPNQPTASAPNDPSPAPADSDESSPTNASTNTDSPEANALANPVAPSFDPPSPHEPVEKSP